MTFASSDTSSSDTELGASDVGHRFVEIEPRLRDERVRLFVPVPQQRRDARGEDGEVGEARGGLIREREVLARARPLREERVVLRVDGPVQSDERRGGVEGVRYGVERRRGVCVGVETEGWVVGGVKRTPGEKVLKD
eukprot:29750-Pelagococcus_subviridis.AAC.5